METTKEERAAWRQCAEETENGIYRDSRLNKRSVSALCRDVDALVRALEAEHALKPPHVPSVGCHLCAVLGPSQGDASIRVEGGECTVDGKRVGEAPPPVAATCRDCGWEFKQRADPPYSWLVVSCEAEHHLLRLFHGSLGSGAPGVPVASVAIDKVLA